MIVLLYRFITGFWEPVEAASRLTFLTGVEEESGLLDEKASLELEPRQCFGVESMISQTVTPVPCGHKGKPVKRGDSYWPF